MIPCYVGGRGKSAHASTKDFKVAVFELLESTAWDTTLVIATIDDSIQT
jgi:hypothetical protein